MQLKITTMVSLVLAATHAQAALTSNNALTSGMALAGEQAGMVNKARALEGLQALTAEQIMGAINGALAENGMQSLTAEEVMDSMQMARSIEATALDAGDLVDAIVQLTDLSDATNQILVDVKSGNVLQVVPNAIKNIKDIVTMATKDVSLVQGASGASFAESDQKDICKAFSGFVKVHQNLLKTIIGDKGLLASTPLTGPVGAVLRSIEKVVDKLAFGIIGLVPTCADQAKKDQAALDATLDKAVAAYPSPIGGLVDGVGNALGGLGGRDVALPVPGPKPPVDLPGMGSKPPVGLPGMGPKPPVELPGMGPKPPVGLPGMGGPGPMPPVGLPPVPPPGGPGGPGGSGPKLPGVPPVGLPPVGLPVGPDGALPVPAGPGGKPPVGPPGKPSLPKGPKAARRF